MPFPMALHSHILPPPPLVPHRNIEGPVHLLPMVRRMRRRCTLPPRYRHKIKQEKAPHNYRMWRPCLLLLYFACFFHTPTVPHTGVPTQYYHTPLQSTSVNSPHNTRYKASGSSNVGTYNPT